MIQMAGGVRRPVTLRAPDFRLDVDELRAAVTPRTRFVLLNSPHNPTGTVLTRAELQAVADVALEHDLVVITDEVYEHLTFGDHEHVPLATLPGMFDRTLTLSSAGKSYSVTGWKVGWATGPADLVARGPRRQPVAHLHLRRPAAAGGRPRARPRAGLAARAGGEPGEAARPPVRRAGGARARRTPSRGHLLRAHRHLVAGLGGRHGVLPGAARAGRRGRDPDSAVPRQPRGRPAGALGLLQGGRRDRGGPTAARRRGPHAADQSNQARTSGRTRQTDRHGGGRRAARRTTSEPSDAEQAEHGRAGGRDQQGVQAPGACAGTRARRGPTAPTDQSTSSAQVT